MLVIIDKLNFYLRKIWSLIKPRRKLGLVSFVVLASLGLVIFVVSTNFAHASIWNDVVDGLFNMIINLIMAIAGWFIKVTFFILQFIIEVAGYNGFIDSDAVIVGWTMVRDVTNMFFVVILLIISFGTILGLEQYEYKKLLVKLLMGAVVVNFSRIICGVIIDVAQVVMITFVNGIHATASGNMVNMFGVDKIFSFSENGNLGSRGLSPGEQFVAAVASLTFAAMMMMTMLTFLFLLMARLMALWILIVLSPFAFILNVLPQTQKYAGQWWSEFGGNVVAGPIIAFFLWLSFVTVGAGNAHERLAGDSTYKFTESSDERETSTGLTSIMSWAQMANFAIAIGMLLMGAKMAQQLGAAGGAMMGKAGEFGKKVAMVASGAAAGRWVAGKAWNVAKKKAPIIGQESLDRKWKSIQAIGGRIKRKMPIVGDIARSKAAKKLSRLGGSARSSAKENWKKGGIWNRAKAIGGYALGYSGVADVVGKVGEGVIETAARANKRVKKREDLLAQFDRAEEIEMGFSESPLGKAITAQEGKNVVRDEEKETKREVGKLLARAAAYRAAGDTDRAEAVENQAGEVPFNKLKEVMKGLTGKELVAQVGRLTKDILKARADHDTAKEEELMQKFYVARSMAIGHDEDWVAKAADEEVMKNAGINKAGKNAQELSLSLDTVDNVSGAAAVGDAASRVTQVLGGKASRAFVRERRKAEKHGLLKGSIDRAATTQDRLNDKTGKIDYIISGNDFGEVDDGTGTGTKRPVTYDEAAKADVGAFIQYIRLSDTAYAPVKNIHRDPSQRIISMDKDESDLIIEKLQGQSINNISQMDGFVKDLNNAVDKATGAVDPRAITELLRIYTELKTRMDPPAYTAFRNRTKEVADAIGAPV